VLAYQRLLETVAKIDGEPVHQQHENQRTMIAALVFSTNAAARPRPTTGKSEPEARLRDR
jgi:hypothetical protein